MIYVNNTSIVIFHTAPITAFCIFLSKIVEVNSTPEIKRAEIEYFVNFTLLHEYLFRSQS
jgi:hypothetical protein